VEKTRDNGLAEFTLGSHEEMIFKWHDFYYSITSDFLLTCHFFLIRLESHSLPQHNPTIPLPFLAFTTPAFTSSGYRVSVTLISKASPNILDGRISPAYQERAGSFGCLGETAAASVGSDEI